MNAGEIFPRRSAGGDVKALGRFAGLMAMRPASEDAIR